MEIRDIVHGSIFIENHELPILDSRYFQRLRQIKQLGFAEHSFPSATHNRYIHSLGAMETATRAFDSIFKGSSGGERIPHDAFRRFRAILRLGALLHDIGHGPLSHTTEFAMPPVRELAVPGLDADRKATHEDYSLKILLDSGLTPILKKAGRTFGFHATHIASLIDTSISPDDDFFLETLNGQVVDFHPILCQIVSSELDADRMDYLRRDALHAGVSYGDFDFDWIISNLTWNIENQKCYLSLEHRALYAFEDFLISRFHMFLMVYFHYKSVIYDSMLEQYLTSPDCDYRLPSDIEAYCDCDDAHLQSHLSKSTHPWARRIAEKKSFRMLVELHSGIPATETSFQEQKALYRKIQEELHEKKIPFLHSTSTGVLSKYFQRQKHPIFIRYDNRYSAPSFIPLEACTELFTKYNEHRSISRIYVSPEDYPKCRNQGRDTPLNYKPDSQTNSI